MNNKIKVFENAEFGSVRTIEEDGKVLFCASDVAKALGYANPYAAVKRHCRGPLTKREGVVQKVNQYGDAGEQVVEISFVTEGDVYRLAAHSKLPGAQQFESWVFDEVVPSIRKNGVYATPEFLQKTISDPKWAMGVLQALADAQDKIAVQQKQISEMKPKATYYDLVLQTKNAVNITTIAKDYGLSAITLNKKLHDYGVQYKQGGTWLLYQQYADMGYTKTRTGVYTNKAGEEYASVHTQWTQKGRMFIYEILKEHGILPKMEEESNVIQFSAM